MRPINKIIVHCSATPEGKDFTVQQIRDCHILENGWDDIGYHFVIDRYGNIHPGRSVEKPGAHAKGHNADSIGICYIGGCAVDGRTPKDTRTPAQRAALVDLIRRLKLAFPNARVYGHNRFAAKACPSFNVETDPDLCDL